MDALTNPSTNMNAESLLCSLGNGEVKVSKFLQPKLPIENEVSGVVCRLNSMALRPCDSPCDSVLTFESYIEDVCLNDDAEPNLEDALNAPFYGAMHGAHSRRWLESSLSEPVEDGRFSCLSAATTSMPYPTSSRASYNKIVGETDLARYSECGKTDEGHEGHRESATRAADFEECLRDLFNSIDYSE